MTTGEIIAYNNGFILGMATKGIIRIGSDAPSGEVIPWFDDGAWGTTGMGDMVFYKQDNGLDNRNTYATDKYIWLSYNGTTSMALAFIISPSNLPKNIYANIKVYYTLDAIPVTMYQPFIGLRADYSYSEDATRFPYHELMVAANTENIATLNLDAYNADVRGMRLHIGCCSDNLKIYKIELEKYS